jgi:hypothetical protein
MFLERLDDRSLPSFITAPSYPVGLGPSYSMAVGDFNSDGAPDFVTANQSSYNVSLLLSKGAGTFQPAVTLANLGYASAAAGDFDGNGTLDLVVANRNLGVNVLLGNGDGTFQPAVNYAAGSDAWSMVVGDFNGDGDPDLAVGNISGGGVSILLSNGDGTFQPAVNYAAGSSAFSIATGDFDSNGILDLTIVDYSADKVKVLRGIGDGTFQPAVGYDTGSQPRSVAVGDFNGDGAPDLAVANRNSDNVSVLLGRGDGTFQPRVDYAAGSGTQAVTVGDWNGDGHTDLATTSFDTNSVYILMGRGDGTFLAGDTFDIGSQPVAIVAGDWDGDGHLDLAAADSATYGGGSPAVSLLMGNGDGTFAAPRSYAVGTDPMDAAVGDFNEDGVPDLVLTNYHSEYVSVLLGRGDGTFEAAVNYAIGTNANPVAVGDFNGDGHLDLVIPDDRLDVLLGNGDGTFGPTTFYLINGLSSNSVATADFNGDGALDIAASNVALGVVTVLLGNGDGSFRAPLYYSAGPDPYSLAVGDFNHDNRIDLVVTNYVLLGNGDGSFQDPVHFGLGIDGRSVAVGDRNGDGNLDLAVAISSTNTVSVFLGYGDGTFTDGTNYPTGYGPRAVAIADTNRDSILDLIVVTGAGFTSTSGTLTVLLGRGDGTFLPAESYTGGLDPQSVAVGDFNGDGFNDLAFANTNADSTTVVLNAGSTTTVAINQAAGQPDPTAGSTISFDVVFSGPVTGFDASDVDLSASTVGGTLVPEVSGSGSNYTITVTGMAGFGTVVATVPANAAIDSSGAPTLASTSTDNTVTFNDVAPTVTIEQIAGQADPTNSSPITFAVHFSEAVTGFDAADISFAGSTVGSSLVADVSGVGQDYTVTVTGMTGAGTVVASIPAGAAVNSLGVASAASTSTDNTVTFDNVPPSVTVNQAVGQADPTNVSSIRFDVIFSEPVTGFTASGVSFAGSTVGGTLQASVAGSGTTYIVTVTGETTRGSVVVSVPAGVVTDAAGNPNTASTSSDNSVEFLNTGVLTFTQAVFNGKEDGTDQDRTVTVTVTRSGQTDGAVSIDYGTSDGTAEHGGGLAGLNDYVPASGTLSWADGVGGSQTFTVQILDDKVNEGQELINLNLTNPVGSPGLGTTTAAVAIAPSDGQVIDAMAKTPSAKFIDQDGDPVTVRLGGRVGTATVYLTDPDGDGKGPIELIELAGTLPDPLKPKAALVVAVAKAKTSTDGGTVGLGAITGTGLRSISARKANLDLSGIDLNGYLGSLTIGNITNGADVTSGAAAVPTQKTRISALAIGDGTAIDVGTPLSSLTATAFGAGSVRAPGIGTILITGDMAADVIVSGAGVDPTRKALGALRVKGAVTGSDIMVNGNVGSVVVGAFRDSRLFAGYTGPDIPDPAGFNVPATVTTFRVTDKADGFENSRVIATAFKSVSIASLDATDPAGHFGFYAHASLGAIAVTGPTRWVYNPARPTPQDLGDFEVNIV